MAELRGGTTIGGFTALHSGLATAFLGGNLRVGLNLAVGKGATGPIDTLNTDRAFLTLRGSGSTVNGANVGVLEFGDSAPDQNGRHVGLIQATDYLSTSSDKRVAGISMWSDGTTANNRGGSISFITKADGGSSWSERARINKDGIFMLNTTTPLSNYKLMVHGPGDLWHAAIGDMGAGILRIGGNTGNGAVVQAINSSTSALRDLYLQRDGGNVGIGTSSPAQKLDVAGNLQVTSNGGALKLVGTDHFYVEYYPDGIAAGRKAYMGYSDGAAVDFTMHNTTGSIVITTTLKPTRLVVPVGTDMYSTI